MSESNIIYLLFIFLPIFYIEFKKNHSLINLNNIILKLGKNNTKETFTLFEHIFFTFSCIAVITNLFSFPLSKDSIINTSYLLMTTCLFLSVIGVLICGRGEESPYSVIYKINEIVNYLVLLIFTILLSYIAFETYSLDRLSYVQESLIWGIRKYGIILQPIGALAYLYSWLQITNKVRIVNFSSSSFVTINLYFLILRINIILLFIYLFLGGNNPIYKLDHLFDNYPVFKIPYDIFSILVKYYLTSILVRIIEEQIFKVNSIKVETLINNKLIILLCVNLALLVYLK